MELQNRLSGANSPYLQQHAHNPVDWHEWGEEALQKARSENLPIIISIGYAACHWCHVMARESFMDPDVAALMNTHFVCIKVDREERPDLDQIYMDACQIISGNGGWPLNAFALPDGRPFFAGTYFTKTQWTSLLLEISKLYKNQFGDIERQAESLTTGIVNHSLIPEKKDEGREHNKDFYPDLFPAWEKLVDFDHGGFNGVPKFILPAGWEFLLQYYYFTKDPGSLNAVSNTLDEISRGGIYDHPGGGFFRYSVDKYWKVPHFEKMLYDNAQLVSLFSHAYQVTGKSGYAETVKQTLDFVQREMMRPEGGFYSSINADSEGEEGKFYCWSLEEIKSVIDPEHLDMILDFYRITPEGNWEDGKNILFTRYAPDECAVKYKLSIDDFNLIRNKSDRLLLEYRNNRIRPTTDDKILTSWNAMMITGFVDAYKALGNDIYLNIAVSNARFLESRMMSADGQVWRVFRNGKISVNGFLDDHAFLALAFIKLYQVTFDIHWLESGKKIVDYCLQYFSDTERSMFFYTSGLAEKLIARKHEISDGVIPSSNSELAIVLFYLGKVYDNKDYLNASLKMMDEIKNHLMHGGPYYANWAFLYGLIINGVKEVAITGEKFMEILPDIQRHYLPDLLFWGGNQENLPLLTKKSVSGKTTIYICKDNTCLPPVENAEQALGLIKGKS